MVLLGTIHVYNVGCAFVVSAARIFTMIQDVWNLWLESPRELVVCGCSFWSFLIISECWETALSMLNRKNLCVGGRVVENGYPFYQDDLIWYLLVFYAVWVVTVLKILRSWIGFFLFLLSTFRNAQKTWVCIELQIINNGRCFDRYSQVFFLSLPKWKYDFFFLIKTLNSHVSLSTNSNGFL